MTTLDNITRRQLSGLLSEATASGDYMQMAICAVAMYGEADPDHASLFYLGSLSDLCVRAINNAEAQR